MKAKLDKNRLVTTKFGKVVPRNQCRYIKDEYYKINEEVFQFMGKWYRINSGFLVNDVETGEWLMKGTQYLLYGLAIDKKGEIICGNFKANPLTNIQIDYSALPENLKNQSGMTVHEVYGSNELVAKKLGLVESLSSGIYTTPKKASKKIAIDGAYHFDVDYSFEYSGDIIKNSYFDYIKNYKPSHVQKSSLLQGLSFGWEFETTDGFIHPRHLITSSLVPLRDGSISGFEYATCPLSGNTGLAMTKEAARVLSKYTTKNTSCSLHLHIGNLPVDEAFLRMLYKVCYNLEDEIYSMFPDFIKQTSKYKERDYCRPLPNLTNIRDIIDFLACMDGYYEGSYRGLGMRNHPVDQENNRKWHIGARYHWVNFVPYVFSKRNTVEFRVHTATTNETKLINWLFICAGIVNFAKMLIETGRTSLGHISLEQIMNKVYNGDKAVAHYLISYIESRKELMRQSRKLGDFIGNLEMQKDLKYTFPFNNKSTLVDI